MFKGLLKKIFISTVAVLPFIANGHSKQSYLPPIFVDKDRLSKIQAAFPIVDKMYKEHAEKNHFPGYAFGIVVDGKLVHSGSGGYADINKKTPVTTGSMFRVASITKSFTAMAILKLRDEGKLKLDDPVYLYIPEIKHQQLTEDAPVITIRHLLTHSAGFPQDDPWGDRKLSETDEALMKLFKKKVFLSNVAGTTYEYSNLGYTMLGYIIKKVSGISFQEYIAKNIWQPLVMKQAEWEFSSIPADRLVHGYQWCDEGWKEERLLHDGSYGAMGGMMTSVESFSRYMALHQAAWPPRNDDEIGPLKRSSIREMHKPWAFDEFVVHPSGHECVFIKAYGYGLRWLRDCQGKVYVKHSGGLPGFGGNWSIMPEYGIGVILFANVTYASTDDINSKVLNTLVETAGLQPRQLPPSVVLNERKNALLKLLPDWKNAESSGIFSANFFLDNPIDVLKRKTEDVFAKASRIIRVRDVIPLNQLRGYFILEGEKANIQINFTLTPENPPLVQEYKIKELVEDDQSNRPRGG